jgi:hypothetical protein
MGQSRLGRAQTCVGFTWSHVAYWILEMGSGPWGPVHGEPGSVAHRTWSRSTVDRVHFLLLPLGPRCTGCTERPLAPLPIDSPRGGALTAAALAWRSRTSSSPTFSSPSCSAWRVLRQGEPDSSLTLTSTTLTQREHDLAMASSSHGGHVL